MGKRIVHLCTKLDCQGVQFVSACWTHPLMRLVGLGSSEADQVLIEIEQYAPDSLRKTIATKNVRKMTNVPRGLATDVFACM